MCPICIADGRINVPALQHSCSWRQPWVLGYAPCYMLVADYAAGVMVAAGVSIWEGVYGCRNRQFPFLKSGVRKLPCSPGPQKSKQTEGS